MNRIDLPGVLAALIDSRAAGGRRKIVEVG